jgi:hypothetical protein
MKRCRQISRFVLIGFVAALLLYFLFVSPAASLSPSLLVRSVRSPLYSDQGVGSVLLTFTNGSGQDVFFEIGKHHVPEAELLTIEKKRGEAWIVDVESQASELTPRVGSVATAVIHWPQGKALDFRVPLPADGQSRRIIARWQPTPRWFSGVPRRIQNLWWQKVVLRRSNFAELRSSLLVIAPGAPRYDFEAAAKRLNAKDIKPSSIEDTNAFLDGFGLGYSIDPKSLKTQ